MNQGQPRWQAPQGPWSEPQQPDPGNVWEEHEPATRWDAGDEPTWQARPGSPQAGLAQPGPAQFGSPPPGPSQFGSPQPGSPQPGSSQAGFARARPMRLGELLGTAVKVVVGNPGVSFGSSLIVGAPAAVALSLAQLTVLNAENQSGPAVAVILTATVLIWAAVSALLGGILVTPVRLWQSGRRAGFHESWRPALRRLGPLAGYTLLVTGAIVAVAALLNGTVVAAADLDPVWFLALLLTLPLTLVVVAWIYVVTVLGVPAIIVEDAGAAGSLRRSRDLLRGSFWPALGTMLLVLAVVTLAQVVIAFPFGLIGGALQGATGSATAATLANAVGVVAQTTVTFPFLSAVIVLLYLDRASRQAGPPR